MDEKKITENRGLAWRVKQDDPHSEFYIVKGDLVIADSISLKVDADKIAAADDMLQAIDGYFALARDMYPTQMDVLKMQIQLKTAADKARGK